MKKASTKVYFPIEICREILKYLPVKPLGRCRCVCKPWNDLIVSSDFIDEHLDTYTRDVENSLLLYRQFSRQPQKIEQYTLLVDTIEGYPDKLEARHTFTCPFFPGVSHYYFRVVGCVNGLICISDDDQTRGPCVILWNPLIHRYIKLPKVIYSRHFSVFGFGYDSQNRDHKVVRIDFSIDIRGFIQPPPALFIQIYSLRQGTWRLFRKPFFMDVCICDRWWSQCSVDKYIYWIAWKKNVNSQVFHKPCLLSFDVETEEFAIVELPEPLWQTYPLELRVSEYIGKLSVIHWKLLPRYVGNIMEHYQLWILTNDPQDPWRRDTSFDINIYANSLRWIQCSLKNGDLLGYDAAGELTSLDTDTGELKGLALSGRRRSWYTSPYTESLILLNDANNDVRTYNETARQGRRYRIVGDRLVLEAEVAEHPNNDDGQNFTARTRQFLREQLYQFLGGPNEELLGILYGFGAEP